MDNRIIEIDYTNHRGERRVRKILPVGPLFFADNQYHTTEQWLFNALDMEHPEQKAKTFALSGLNNAGGADRATELLEANNELLQRARDAEGREKAALDEIGELKAALGKARAYITQTTRSQEASTILQGGGLVGENSPGITG